MKNKILKLGMLTLVLALLIVPAAVGQVELQKVKQIAVELVRIEKQPVRTINPIITKIDEPLENATAEAIPLKRFKGRWGVYSPSIHGVMKGWIARNHLRAYLYVISPSSVTPWNHQATMHLTFDTDTGLFDGSIYFWGSQHPVEGMFFHRDGRFWALWMAPGTPFRGWFIGTIAN